MTASLSTRWPEEWAKKRRVVRSLPSASAGESGGACFGFGSGPARRRGGGGGGGGAGDVGILSSTDARAFQKESIGMQMAMHGFGGGADLVKCGEYLVYSFGGEVQRFEDRESCCLAGMTFHGAAAFTAQQLPRRFRNWYWWGLGRAHVTVGKSRESNLPEIVTTCCPS
jgi:hypothetical protein